MKILTFNFLVMSYCLPQGMVNILLAYNLKVIVNVPGSILKLTYTVYECSIRQIVYFVLTAKKEKKLPNLPFILTGNEK